MKLNKMEEIKLHFIGSGDAFGSGGRFSTCFYVNAPSKNFLIDCGISSLIGLRKYQIDPNGIDVILLTHYHGDHYGGVPYIILYGNTIGKRKNPLTIAGPKGCKENVLNLMEQLYPGSTSKGFGFDLQFKEYHEGEPLHIEEIKLVAYKVVHTQATLPHGLRISIDGKIIGFSGDTEWTDNLLKISQGSDLFICECNNYASDAPGHLSYLTILQHKEQWKTKRIILNHFGSEMLDNLQKSEIELAEDGKSITI
jgi:ribonuclease BN (tRNA processing enzyme)